MLNCSKYTMQQEKGGTMWLKRQFSDTDSWYSMEHEVGFGFLLGAHIRLTVDFKVGVNVIVNICQSSKVGAALLHWLILKKILFHAFTIFFYQTTKSSNLNAATHSVTQICKYEHITSRS